MMNKSGNKRGTSPRSHGNHNKGGKKKTSVSLLYSTIKEAKKLGDNLSDGIDKLFSTLPVFRKAKMVVELSLDYLPEDKKAIAKSVLFELEDLEIEQAYEEVKVCGEAIAPSAIKVGDSYIV